MSTPDRPLRIDVVVHGRFHAFELVRALVAAGHDVQLLTNYPRFIVKRFGVTGARVTTCVWHGICARLYHRAARFVPMPAMERWVHRAFSRWAARHIRPQIDAVHVFSGVAEEVFLAVAKAQHCTRVMVRGSAHIRTQHRLLLEEEERCGLPVEKPSPWMIAREEREYALADRVVVLSSFARNSFLDQGVPADKVRAIGLASNLSRFEPAQANVAQRLGRIRAGEPLHVLMVGSFSFRKGALDFIEVARRGQGRMLFRFVGDVPAHDSPLHIQSRGLIDLIARVPESELAAHYAWGDVFCFPTIEDGFAVVIAQALTARLPAITTTNCAGPDVITEELNGWVVPIRQPRLIAERLEWCDNHREELASLIEWMPAGAGRRNWSDVALELERLIRA